MWIDGMDMMMIRGEGRPPYDNFAGATEVAIETNPTTALFVLPAIAAFTAYGFLAALGGQPAFGVLDKAAVDSEMFRS